MNLIKPEAGWISRQARVNIWKSAGAGKQNQKGQRQDHNKKKNPKNYTKTIVQTRERDKLKRRTGNRVAMGDIANLHKRRGAR